jgi:hypothetical protein
MTSSTHLTAATIPRRSSSVSTGGPLLRSMSIVLCYASVLQMQSNAITFIGVDANHKDIA